MDSPQIFEKKDRGFVLAICRLINDSEFSRREKMKLRSALFFSAKARKKAKEQVNDGLVALGITKGWERIDWENFDWEAAKEFWIEVLKVIAEIIVIFI